MFTGKKNRELGLLKSALWACVLSRRRRLYVESHSLTSRVVCVCLDSLSVLWQSHNWLPRVTGLMLESIHRPLVPGKNICERNSCSLLHSAERFWPLKTLRHLTDQQLTAHTAGKSHISSFYCMSFYCRSLRWNQSIIFKKKKLIITCNVFSHFIDMKVVILFALLSGTFDLFMHNYMFMYVNCVLWYSLVCHFLDFNPRMPYFF